MNMREWLTQLYKNNKIRAIDLQFALFIGEQVGLSESPIVAWAALTSFELGKGNICVDLAKLDTTSLFDLPFEESNIAYEKLAFDQAYFMFDDVCAVDTSANENLATPFVLMHGRLYLRRYWQAERVVAAQILKRAVSVELPKSTRKLLDDLFQPDVEFIKKLMANVPAESKAEKWIDLLDIVQPEKIDLAAAVAAVESNAPHEEILKYAPDAVRLNWQKVAAAAALSYKFAVISGGPGTGKTTTVAKLLAALVSTHTGENHLEIKLVAPTGKAANRLTESIGKAVESLPVAPEIRQKIPVLASTIHRLLGAIPQRVEFRHNELNRLHLDILVVDEASMVDLSLMARLLTALPDHARVILLGDRDQLASVEAGSVLGDICENIDQGYSPARAHQLFELTGFEMFGSNEVSKVSDGVCLLRKSYRFHAKSGVGQLAGAINSGQKKQIDWVWKQKFSDICWHALSDDVYPKAIAQCVQGYQKYLIAMKEGQNHRTILKYFGEIRMLCALTEGNYGVAGLNHHIESALVAEGLIAIGEHRFYTGRPVMVTQNDHALGLYNGDIGIVLETDEGLRVVFELSDGSVKPFLPSRLPAHQTAYAMTIHKSQGSEFDHTIIVFPPSPSPVMNRELVYTGVTRAKSLLDIYATEYSFIKAIERKTERFSGLTDALAADLTSVEMNVLSEYH